MVDVSFTLFSVITRDDCFNKGHGADRLAFIKIVLGCKLTVPG